MQRDMERLIEMIFTWWANQPKDTLMPPFVQEAVELDSTAPHHDVGLMFHPERGTLTVQTGTDRLIIEGFTPTRDGQAHQGLLSPIGQEKLIKKLVAHMKLAD